MVCTGLRDRARPTNADPCRPMLTLHWSARVERAPLLGRHRVELRRGGVGVRCRGQGSGVGGQASVVVGAGVRCRGQASGVQGYLTFKKIPPPRTLQ